MDTSIDLALDLGNPLCLDFFAKEQLSLPAKFLSPAKDFFDGQLLLGELLAELLDLQVRERVLGGRGFGEALPAQAQGLARVAFDDGDGPETRWEPDAVTVTLGAVAVPLPPGAFLQATREGEAALVMGGMCGECRVRDYSRAPTVVTVGEILRGAREDLVTVDGAERRK